MLTVLRNRTYRHLFLAQIIALLGTGLTTIALGLLAYELAGENAGAVLGTALAIKMIAYVTIAPIAGAFANLWPRRTLLVTLDIIRDVATLLLPFISEIWHIYILIFVLQSASAAFTPMFQATIPDILTDEKDYTNALSLSRLAYDLENLISPALAAILLTVIPFSGLFGGTVFGFLASAAFVVSVTLPSPKMSQHESVWERTTKGIRIYFATPRLRGLLAICLSVSMVGAMVLVNTVVIVQNTFGLEQQQTAWALASFGAGSMLAALILPRLLDRLSDRTVMLAGAMVLACGLIIAAFLVTSYAFLLPLWFFLGIGYSVAQTPSGRLLRRSAHSEDRPALFAAHFALSHACWLLAYPVAGWSGTLFGLSVTAFILAGIAAIGILAATLVWPSHEKDALSYA